MGLTKTMKKRERDAAQREQGLGATSACANEFHSLEITEEKYVDE